MSWTQEPLRLFQHLLREADADRLDAEALVEEAHSCGANGLVIMGGGFSAWYPTKVAMQRVNPRMSGDFLGEVLAEAKARGMRVIARLDISKGRAGLEQSHPDALVRDPSGKIATVWGMPQVCATGPIWQDDAFAIIDELVDNYPALDGIFFNYFHVARCYCARCNAVVRDATGTSIPSPGEWVTTYERWRQGYLADYLGRMRDHIHARAPYMAVIPYHHVRDGWDIRRMAEVSDVLAAQISNPLIPNPVDPQPNWTHWAAEEAMTAWALKPDVPPLLFQTTSEVFASRQSAMPDARLQLNILRGTAAGGRVVPAVNGRLHAGDARFVAALRQVGRDIAAHSDWYHGLKPSGRIALLRSEDSRLFGVDAGRMAGAPDGSGHVAEFRGLFEMLSDLGYPLELVLAGALDSETLSRFDLVIAPGVQCLSPEDAALLDDYVADGGVLLATADTGICDADGVPRETPPLSCLRALPGRVRNIDGGYLARRRPDAGGPLEGVAYVAAAGAFWQPFAENGPEDDLFLVGPFVNNAPEFTEVSGPGEAPGKIFKHHGRGRAIWLPWRIGALYGRHGVPEYRAILGELLYEQVGAAPLVHDGGPAVEAVLTAHPLGQVLHLLNRGAVTGRPFSQLSPVAGFEVAVETGAIEVVVLAGEAIAFRRDGRSRLILTVPRLDNYVAVAMIAGTAEEERPA
ncbi:alpha-amylase family protein [Halovulum marinum]|uniref:alpha-amylase family protein n=1 Tax=Halovulum marinum TaxID=2662447 RepID=UPI001F297072|nr:alpha-amylase family protein [Halovulum marinum]